MVDFLIGLLQDLLVLLFGQINNVLQLLGQAPLEVPDLWAILDPFLSLLP